MARNTSISLGSHFEEFIQQQVAEGRYGTASEVIRAGLRLLEDDETRLEALRAGLDDGEASGFAEDYSLDGVMKAVLRKR